MANYKITELTELAATPESGDFTVIVDVSDTTMAATGTTKKLSASRLVFQNSSNDVGLGTSSPSFRLHLSDIGDMLRLSANTSSGQAILSFAQQDTRRAFIQFINTNQSLNLISEYGDVAFFAASSAGSDSDTEYMRIKSGGNIGIGTSSPNSKLDVVGTVQMDALRLDQTPTAGAVTLTHYVTISMNGTTYRVPCGTA